MRKIVYLKLNLLKGLKERIPAVTAGPRYLDIVTGTLDRGWQTLPALSDILWHHDSPNDCRYI